jgi:CHRD domain-containing protein
LQNSQPVNSETFSGLQGTVTQSHIHVGQLGVNGSVVIFLCQTAANPDPTGRAPQCPQQGTVSGEITTANVIAGATTSQQLAAGDLAAVIAAIRAGAAYANVHTTPSPGGEIRGQLRRKVEILGRLYFIEIPQVRCILSHAMMSLLPT